MPEVARAAELGLIEAISAAPVLRRIIGWFGLGGTLEGGLVQGAPAVSRDIFKEMGLLRAPSSLPLNVSGDGAPTSSLGNLLRCFTTLVVTNAFPVSSLNLPSFSLKPLGLVLSLQALLRSLSPSLFSAPSKY